MRRRSFRPFSVLGASASVAVALTLSGAPAAAVDQSKPTPSCAGLAFRDPGGDQNHLQVPEAERTPATEMINGFLKHEPAQGAEATTYNLTVKEMKKQIPSGWTTISWNLYYKTPDGTTRFVRAILDFSGATAFEYGTFVPNPSGAGLTGASQYEGTTPGKLFEGTEGVLQLVVPPTRGGSPGTAFTELYATSGQGRTAPASSSGQSRGVSHVMDTAPDGGAAAGGRYIVNPCPGDGSTGGGVGETIGGGGGGGGAVGGGSTGQTQTGAFGRALPVRLVTTATRARKIKRRRLVLKVRSTERVTALSAQLRSQKRGRSRVVGRGKLRTVNGRGTLRLKLRGRIRKGAYVLDLVGNDASGQRLFGAARLRIR